ncbi:MULTISPECIES: AraC family transcriptional regulator [Clostridium]|uniref:AraC family transcriptional regulator n=1 Tax=Clostridium TaxID=1485 RepID=UPI00069FE2BB|nr:MULTISPECIES: AraC family transcriptional regulator [Clostridium]KOF57789.1 AraC family transcriptional regulator [Clostridium sp. DMHC 10]MCD2346310.1 AraC family transcriptional regulator [Clostridium guangxiense]
MCDLGINVNSFNPKILYVFNSRPKENYVIDHHSHDFLEFSYMLSGETSYIVNDNIYNVKKGQLMVFNPGVYHSEIVNKYESLNEIHIGFNNINIRSFSPNHITKENFLGIFNFQRYGKDFENCCIEILKEQSNHKDGYELMLKILSTKLLVMFLRETYFEESRKKICDYHFEFSQKSNIVKEIIAYMNKNYMNNISLYKISKNMYLSPVYISKIFKEETGVSPINYLIKIRLEKAKALLKDTTLTVKTIAKSVGYDDAYYFSKLFKKYYNISPSRYKNR